MSAAVLQARISLMEGVVKLMEDVMDGIVMLTTVACLFCPDKEYKFVDRTKRSTANVFEAMEYCYSLV